MRENEILELKKSFTHEKGSAPGSPSIPVGEEVTSEHVKGLIKDLKRVKEFWTSEELGIDPLIGTFYNRMVAKSNRINRLFSYSAPSANSLIVGAKFYDGPESPKHQITYSVSAEDIDASIAELEHCAAIIHSLPGHKIDKLTLDAIMKNEAKVDLSGMAKSTFGRIVRDACFVDKFDITEFDENIAGPAVVSLFRVNGAERDEILKTFGIEVTSSSILDDAILLSGEDFSKLKNEAPHLIAMAVEDLADSQPEDYILDTVQHLQPTSIPLPSGEPTVGVIDSAFFEDVYFAKGWVEYHPKLDGITVDDNDRRHGTAVTSIIVDGPRLNPAYDDGCGHFQVRHFCVAPAKRFSSFSVMKKVKDIVEQNPDIKVWNLSLGSELAVRANSISPEAAILDRLQAEKKIIFVVAGTNNSKNIDDLPIGAPADSINSLVVNSVDSEGNPASYSRRGPVLSFHSKPDVSYYGGTPREPMTVAAPYAATTAFGTSIAAPWIARKLAYLIHTMRLEPQVAKALLIHSATSWEKIKQSNVRGYGVVPVRIEDILRTNRDEIRFIITQDLTSYRTMNVQLPIPFKSERFPFKVRATLCYFPHCSRNQGVDYTDSEVSLSFGAMGKRKVTKVDEDGNKTVEEKPCIKPINNDSQDMEGTYVNEHTARKFYRKWDNVKHIGEILKSRNPGLKKHDTHHWGISFTLKHRLDNAEDVGVRVGLVVTLKEVNGVNRLGEFRHMLEHENWIVNSIDMDARAHIVERAQIEELEFDE